MVRFLRVVIRRRRRALCWVDRWQTARAACGQVRKLGILGPEVVLVRRGPRSQRTEGAGSGVGRREGGVRAGRRCPRDSAANTGARGRSWCDFCRACCRGPLRCGSVVSRTASATTLACRCSFPPGAGQAASSAPLAARITCAASVLSGSMAEHRARSAAAGLASGGITSSVRWWMRGPMTTTVCCWRP